MSDTEHEPVSALTEPVLLGELGMRCHLRSNSRTHVCDCLLHYAFAGRGLIVRHVKKSLLYSSESQVRGPYVPMRITGSLVRSCRFQSNSLITGVPEIVARFAGG